MSRARDSEAATLAAHLALSPCAIPTNYSTQYSTVRALVVDLYNSSVQESTAITVFVQKLREVRSSDLCFLNDRAVLLHL